MSDPTIELLKELVSIPSISAEESRRPDAQKTAQLIKSKLEDLGTEVMICTNEQNGLNPLVLGRLGTDPAKKTLALYSHYDVQPAALEDGWDTEPFRPTEKDGYLYGRGVSDDKGPIAAAITAIESLNSEGVLPINIRFLYEGEEESSSGGFEDTLTKHREFLGKIDGIIILDTGWFSDTTPSLDYGFRGISYMGIEVSGPKKDIHSGMGGSFREPMEDLIAIMGQFKDLTGKILIDGFYDKVKPLTSEEKAMYEVIDFDPEEFRVSMGLNSIVTQDKDQLLMNQWRYPSLSLHGIQGAFSTPGTKTVIPAKVVGKVSMRLVPDQDPDEIVKQFADFVINLFAKLDSPNTLNVLTLGTGNWWFGDPNNSLYTTARKVLKEHWGIDPILTRSGGSIPIVPFMEECLSANAIGFPIGQFSDGAHSQNERIRLKNLIGGREVLKKFFIEIASEN